MLTNISGSDITGVAVKGGKVEGFRRTLAKQSRSFTVIMDGDTCLTRVRIKFADGNSVDQENYDVCSEHGIIVY